MGLVSVKHVSFHSTQLLFPRTEELCVREEAWFKACRDSCPTMKAEPCDPRFKPLPTVDTKDETKDVLAVDLKHPGTYWEGAYRQELLTLPCENFLVCVSAISSSHS